MDNAVTCLWWLLLLLVLCSWIFYPLVVFLLSRLVTRHEPVRVLQTNPRLSFLISAYNEETNIVARIHNLISISDNFSFEILIGSDGSTDNTVRRVEELGLPNVRIFDFKENRGKATVHNTLVRAADGDVLIFTDSETLFEQGFLKIMLPHFEDAVVGAVSGRIYYLNSSQSSIGESAGLYWKYEEMIRVAESRLGILAFGTGAALAFRKTAYTPLSPSEDIDYAGTLACVRKGYKVQYEPAAKAYDYISETSRGAFQTRIRQTRRSFLSIARGLFQKELIFRKPAVFVSGLLHKTFRHLTPFFLLSLLLLSCRIYAISPLYMTALVLQLAFYGFSLAGYALDSLIGVKPPLVFSIPYNFLLLNISRGIGVIYALLRDPMTGWVTRR